MQFGAKWTPKVIKESGYFILWYTGFMSEQAIPTPNERLKTTHEYERRPLDFLELAAGDVDVLMLGEHHLHTALFDAIAQNAPALRAAGIQALLTETSGDQDFSDVNAGDFSRLDSGELEAGPPLRIADPFAYRELGGQDPPTEARNRMVKALVAEGIPIVPIDSAEHHAQMKSRFEGEGATIPWHKLREREDVDMSANLDAAIAEYGKVALLIGRSHTRKGIQTSMHGDQFKQIAQIATDHGHRVRTAQFFGAESITDGAERRLYFETARSGSGPFMYRPQEGDPLAKGDPDWVAFVPPAKFEKDFA